MPWLTWPNRITIARIVLVTPLVICLLNINSGLPTWRYLSLGLFILLSVSDAIDGFLARWLKQETPLGRFLDPLADKLLVVCAVVILAVDGTAVPGFQLPSWVPVIAIGKDLLTVLGFLLIYATTGQFFIQPRRWGKACTTVQLVMIAVCLLAPDAPALLRPVHRFSYWLASALAIVAWVDYLRVGNRFAADYHASMQRTTE